MIAIPQQPDQASPFWVSFKNDPPEEIIRECFKELSKSLKLIEVDRQLLAEMQIQNPNIKASIERISSHSDNMRRSMESYKVLGGLRGNAPHMKFTQEVPNLLVQELNDCLPGSIKFTGQNMPGLLFLADHEMLVKALVLLLKFSNPKSQEVSAFAAAFDEIVTLKFTFKESISVPKVEGLCMRLMYQVLSIMGVPIVFDEQSIELAFKRVRS